MVDKNFILFADCIPVKGINRSIICDTKNNNYYYIPNGLYDILVKYNGRSINFIKQKFKNQYDVIIDEYFEFLKTKKIIFFNNNLDLFPRINTEWSSPSKITNIIIDSQSTILNLKDIVEQLEGLKCSYVQFRFFSKISFDYLNLVCELFKANYSRVVSIDFFLPFDSEFKTKELMSLMLENTRIHSIILYNAPDNNNFEPLFQKMGYLILAKRNILNEKYCGIVNDEYFYSNIKLFSESQHHNTCLNRKISIDINGDIKNCPSMAQSFGNIKNTTLEQAMEHADFKKYWNITKDQIAVCKDCEFRHICTDCRAYIEDPNDQYSKPLKCGYNPYTNVWEEWSTNPLKQKAIEYYGMQDLVKKDA